MEAVEWHLLDTICPYMRSYVGPTPAQPACPGRAELYRMVHQLDGDVAAT